MKRLVVLILILTLFVTTFGVMSISAEGDTKATSLVPRHYDMVKLNEPIYDDINYYINIKSPTMFASYDKVLAVVQGNDILVKIDRHIETIKDAATIVIDGKECTLKSITIDSKSDTLGYIYLTYVKELATYETVIYEYLVKFPTTIGSWITKIGSFGDYLTHRHIVADETLVSALNTSASDICYNNNAIYIVVGKTGDICKIGNDSISLLDIDENGKASISTSKAFTVSNNEDILIYGVKDRENEIYKKSSSSKSFTKVASQVGLIDMTAKGDYVYLLTKDALKVKSINNMSSADPAYSIPFSTDCLAFDVSTIGGVNYISFALTGNDNILTYKEVIKDGKISLEFYNHYGANCTCDTPHQGWLNAPTKIVTNADESTIYTVDNGDKRLVATKYDARAKKYIQHYYDATLLNINSGISALAVDAKNTLYIASADKVFAYNNSEKYEEKLPFTRKTELSGFDSAVVDIKVLTTTKSVIYILTDKGSLYTISEGDSTPTMLAQLGNDVERIYPSSLGDKIYTATNNAVMSYTVSDIDVSKPVTTLLIDDTIKDFGVDYKGDIYALVGNVLRRYSRTGDNSYKFIDAIDSKNRWNNVNSMYIHPSNKGLYFVDSTLHISEKIMPNTNWGYANSSDTYVDSHVYDETLKYVAKTNKDTLVYNDPTNYEVNRLANEGEYFYVLSTNKDNKGMYLVVDKNSDFRYIPTSALTKVQATTNCIYGNTLVPLRGVTNVYALPFANEKSEPIDTVTGSMSLIDNVAYENDSYVWQNKTTRWFKVRYTSTNNIELEGYVMMNEVSRSSSIVAPETRIHLRVKTKAVETVALYDAPDLASGILLDGIKNGTLVRLAEEKFDETKEFTRVEIEDKDGKLHVGYMLTEHLQKNTFTTQQILAIVLSVITVLITILVIVLVVQYKKKQNKINTFKSEE